jgi:hypothetical protein
MRSPTRTLAADGVCGRESDMQRHRNEWGAVHGLYASEILRVVYEHAQMSLDEGGSSQGVLTKRSRISGQENLHHPPKIVCGVMLQISSFLVRSSHLRTG